MQQDPARYRTWTKLRPNEELEIRLPDGTLIVVRLYRREVIVDAPKSVAVERR